MKIGTKKSEVLCLSRNTNQCVASKQKYTATGRKVKYLDVAFTSDRKLNKEFIAWADTVVCELYCSTAVVINLTNLPNTCIILKACFNTQFVVQ